MRIVAGKYRHRLISYPENNPGIRPTKDRIREAIFSALGNIEGKVCCDLYAGSGAMGLEALSRGANKIYFNDISKEALKVTKDNLVSLNVSNDEYCLSHSDDYSFLTNLKRTMDIYFIDPPYKKGEYEKIISFILDNSLINDFGIIVVESNTSFNVDESLFSKIKQYSYGEIKVTILWR